MLEVLGLVAIWLGLAAIFLGLAHVLRKRWGI